MIDFSLTEEQRALVAMTREFVDRHIKPITAEMDRRVDPAQCFPWEVIDEGARLGLKTLTLPKGEGGVGADAVTVAMLLEELGVGDLGLATIFMQCWDVSRAILKLGTAGQRHKFLGAFRQEPRYLFAIGMTEPEAGSDNIIPCDDPAAGLKLAAVLEGDEVVLNGTKVFITAGDVSRLYMVFARTDKSVGIAKGMTAFLVPAGIPGFTIGTIYDKVGQRLSTNAELVFQDCRIPKENQLTPWNGGIAAVGSVLRESNAHRAATFLGVARACFEEALGWARTRVQGGKRIIEHQVIASKLAEMWMLIEVARSTIWKAAWAADSPEYFDLKLARIPKLFTSEVTMKVAIDAVQLHGGYGIMKDMRIEKLSRDALTVFHSQGPNEVLKVSIGNQFRET